MTSSETHEGICVIVAEVPLAEMFDYADEIRGMTQGQGNFTMEFSHYSRVPRDVQEPVLAKHRQKKLMSVEAARLRCVEYGALVFSVLANGQNFLYAVEYRVPIYTRGKALSQIGTRDDQNADLTGPSEVLTLAEAAQYLQVSEASVIDLTSKQQLPGRKIGDQWRFFKSGLADWLLAQPASKRLLRHAGALSDDPNANAMLEEIYQRRGRTMTDEST